MVKVIGAGTGGLDQKMLEDQVMALGLSTLNDEEDRV